MAAGSTASTLTLIAATVFRLLLISSSSESESEELLTIERLGASVAADGQSVNNVRCVERKEISEYCGQDIDRAGPLLIR